MSINQKRIIWADDELEFLQPHKIFLEKKGFEVVTVNSGEDAIDSIQKNNFDLLLIDEMMTGIDGLTTIKKLRSMNFDLPIIMITKNEEEWLMEEAIAGNIDNFLTKPVNPSQILSACKSILQFRQIQSDYTSKEYIIEFQKINESIHDISTLDQWYEVYDKLVTWSLRFDRHDQSGLKQLFDDQFSEINEAFNQFIVKNYSNWIKEGKTEKLVTNIFKNHLKPAITQNEKVCLIVIDCMRMDHIKVMLPLLSEYFNIQHDYAISLLPSATPYARNGIFSGMLPIEIQSKFPEKWDEMMANENSHNQFESYFLRELMNKNGFQNKSMKYYKTVTINDGKNLESHFAEYRNIDVIGLVVNYIDILGHAKSESKVIGELLHDESAYRDAVHSWFENSWLISILKELASWDHKVIITSDHGSIRVEKPTMVKGDKETSAGIRYKHGRNIHSPEKGGLTIDSPGKYGLPRESQFNNYIIAKNKHFFVYPNNYNKFVQRLKNSFQHGGISMEELIVPVTTLVGK
jgi:CheY-like chemotaxis protein